MKLKYILKKNLNIRNGYLIAIMVTLILVVGGCFSYAVFTATSESKGALNIITGNLYPYLDSQDLDANKEVALAPNEVKYIRIKLTNINTIDAKVNLYYTLSDVSNKVEIGYIKTSDTPPTNVGYVLEKSGSGKDSKTIDIRIINNDTKNIIVKFGSNIGLETANLNFPTGANVLTPINGNENIVQAYTYNQVKDTEGFCVTGEEPTCQINDCFSNSVADSCPIGTIVRYRVTDNDVRYFHVMKDDGKRLTMQQRENTTENTKWYHDINSSLDTANNGPITILELLNSKTSQWKYVNNQTFKMGETVFSDNAFTGCGFDYADTYQFNGKAFYNIRCDKNTYVMDAITMKARLITAQEALAYGCKIPDDFDVQATCPMWMYNYLSSSVYYGGTVDYAGSDGYFTMSARAYYQASDAETKSLQISYDGQLKESYISYDQRGARAVIEVNK